MCGIVGYWQPHGRVEPAAILSMTHRLYHRGPDDAGIWVDPTVGIALGHRRLAVQDLSPAGSQPMCSADGRWVIVYNGEVYNHEELRRQLEAEGCVCRWRGHSDTETLLEAIAAWGLETALQRAAGMFALAAWDRVEQRLYLARDRMGEKPLYYGWQGDTFLFASELKAFYDHPAFEGKIDRAALRQLLLWGYIPAPFSIYQGIFKLPAGTFLALHTPQVGVCPTPQPYWSLCAVAQAGIAHPFSTEQEALESVEATLRRVVRQQMVADVPVGAFLSGGIDSSLIVALMQTQSSRPVHTFTIGFEEKSLDEAPYARAVARCLGTDHHEVYLAPADALSVIPQLPTIYDEPFADASQIPTVLVAQQARRQVTVALTGDGGDESTGGYYDVYREAIAVHRHVQRVPTLLRRVCAAFLRNIPAPTLVPLATVLLRGRLRGAFSQRQIHLLIELLASDARLSTVYRILRARWRLSETVVIGNPATLMAESLPPIDDPYLYLMAIDSTHYLPDDVLVKVDRAAMSVSLETRAPLLDHRVVEVLWRLPLSLRIRDGAGKWLLRQLLYRYVPRELVDRPKHGFAIPLDSWLRGPLRDWAEELLRPQRLRQEGFLYPEPIHRVWQAHLRSEQQWGHLLWPVLMFQAWQEHTHRRPN